MPKIMPKKSGIFFFGLKFMSVVAIVLFIWPTCWARGEVQVIPQTVRIGLMQNAPRVVLQLQGEYRLINANTGQVIDEDKQGHRWTVENSDGLLSILKDGSLLGTYNGPIKVEQLNSIRSILAGDGALVQKDSLSGLTVQDYGQDVQYLSDEHIFVISGDEQIEPLPQGKLNLICLEKSGEVKRYRGNLEIRLIDEGFTVINELPIEEYLYGVVSAEMPTSFPLEALKAQAVASRSCLITQLGSYADHGFDVLDNQSNQMYNGYDNEDENVILAVNKTKSLVMVYRGQPISAFFHSSSGGFIENSEDVWRDSLSYLRAKEDLWDTNDKYYNWEVNYLGNELTSVINQQLKKFMNPGEFNEFIAITDLQELERTNSGQRIKKLLIEGTDIEYNQQQLTVYNADKVRNTLGLRSSLFTMQIEKQPDGVINYINITGSGWGHGLGMSQWGAAGMATNGYSFQDILQYYYTDVDLVQNYGM